MKTFPAARIRNVALVGHGGAGKTTLAEALLLDAGVISRPGRVEDGTTTTDFDPEEVKRGISLSLALAPFERNGYKVNLLDVPGYADFVTDVHTALRVADLAIIVVSAVEGPEVQTEVAWRLAAEAGVARMFFVTKLDRERADFDRTVDQLREHFGDEVVPVQFPIGGEGDFRGVVDLLADVAFTYDNGVRTQGEPPPEIAEGRAATLRDNLVEGIVVADDNLMERYLEGETPDVKVLDETLAEGVAQATVFPVACGSPLRGVGVDLLAQLVCDIGPSPLDRPPVTVQAGDGQAEVSCDPSGQPLALVYRTLADPFVGRVSYLKVLSGTIRPDTHLTNSRTHGDERLHALFTMRGKDHDNVTELVAGDLGAVAKLSGTATGDTLAAKGMPVVIPPPALPEPVLSVAVLPRTKGDEDKLMTGLHRLQEEDPALHVRRDDETHQTILSGMGDTHLTVVAERLARKFGVAVETEDVRVAYRETITAPAEAEGKHKKQSGGHGQFGVASLRIEPLPRGGGFEFVDKIVGGAVPRQFIPAVEKGVAETMAQAGVCGYPVVDIRVTLFDGKFHPVDSSEMSFKMAGSIGFREAMTKAHPVVLEPVSALTVTVPLQYQGDIMGDLNSRRGRVQGTEAAGDGEQAITALVPTSEVLRYAIDLRSMTGGRGRFSLHHDHYDLLPSHLVDRVARKP
ncbi:MAG: elongation factor G [Acidimicrobiia bacterium]|nr:elongation factor G [Acidimicrobiia bacterium]